ncbi:putative bifunctional diguanylate cyclase/phosphodiesterase [Planosporangium sp. 12N6]|uniref:putative bifunctional diguanylate cyclase/phosphodiesterase n=1 Tax=Planosporangium spinosum TaxID=3402278 RepID=UPI003CF558B6
MSIAERDTYPSGRTPPAETAAAIDDGGTAPGGDARRTGRHDGRHDDLHNGRDPARPGTMLTAPDLTSAAALLARLAAAGRDAPESVVLSRDAVVQTARTLQQLQTAIDNIPAPIFSKDIDGVYGACNKAFEAYVGVGRGDIIGRTVHEIWPAELADVYAEADRAALAAGGSQIYDAQVRYADGSVHDVTFYKGVFTDDRGRPQGLAGAILDITDRRALEAKLRALADSDPLTGLANRALFSRRLDEAAARADADHRPAVLLIDLDDFKLINDNLGHDAGDRLLVAAAEVVRRSVRDADTVARLGGDEFAVLMEDARADEVEPLVRRILTALAGPADSHPLAVRASIGVAYGRAGERGADLLRHADIALYAAKDRGKGECVFYRPDMKARVVEQAALLDGLRHALAGNQLHLEYQPIVTIDGGALVAVEALVRWRHPTRGPVPPGDFIPVAEHGGLIVPIGRWILERACEQAGHWQRTAAPHAPFATHVNVSAHQLRAPGFVDDVRNALAATGLDPAGLVVEITETAMADDAAAVEALRAVRGLGVRVALDDFGTGQSSLGVLASCPVDLIKVDKSFVDHITGSDRHAAVARAVLGLAGTLGIEAVAEGVENAAQARCLYDMGYRHAQGFHFARPISGHGVDRLLTGTRSARFGTGG